jgi:hypothetical protein
VDGVPDALAAARLAAEEAIGVRHGDFQARPYLARLLGAGPAKAPNQPGRGLRNAPAPPTTRTPATWPACRARSGSSIVIATTTQDLPRILRS